MPIFIYYFDCILQESKFINVTAFRMVNIYLRLFLGNLYTNKSIVAYSGTCINFNLLDLMHKWAWVMAVSLNYCTPLHLSLNFCNGFNRQTQKNDKIKFWKSIPSYVLVRKYQWRKKIIFIPSNKWEDLKNVLFYRQQIAYNTTHFTVSFDVKMTSFSVINLKSYVLDRVLNKPCNNTWNQWTLSWSLQVRYKCVR